MKTIKIKAWIGAVLFSVSLTGCTTLIDQAGPGGSATNMGNEGALTLKVTAAPGEGLTGEEAPKQGLINITIFDGVGLATCPERAEGVARIVESAGFPYDGRAVTAEFDNLPREIPLYIGSTLVSSTGDVIGTGCKGPMTFSVSESGAVNTDVILQVYRLVLARNYSTDFTFSEPAGDDEKENRQGLPGDNGIGEQGFVDERGDDDDLDDAGIVPTIGLIKLLSRQVSDTIEPQIEAIFHFLDVTDSLVVGMIEITKITFQGVTFRVNSVSPFTGTLYSPDQLVVNPFKIKIGSEDMIIDGKEMLIPTFPIVIEVTMLAGQLFDDNGDLTSDRIMGQIEVKVSVWKNSSESSLTSFEAVQM